MTVGYPVDKGNIDSRAGEIAVGVRDALDRATRFSAWLDGKTVSELEGYGYTTAEANLLKASFIDLAKLNQVATGKIGQPGANDFFWNAKNLTGVIL